MAPMKIRFHTLAMSDMISILIGGLASNIPEASVHENRLYNIGNKDYWITVGWIGSSAPHNNRIWFTIML